MYNIIIYYIYYIIFYSAVLVLQATGGLLESLLKCPLITTETTEQTPRLYKSFQHKTAIPNRVRQDSSKSGMVMVSLPCVKALPLYVTRSAAVSPFLLAHC
jgi:hypothetical protein